MEEEVLHEAKPLNFGVINASEFVAFMLSGPGVVKASIKGEVEKIFWIILSDEEGIIVSVDENFNVIWNGDEESCKERLHKVLVIERIEEINNAN